MRLLPEEVIQATGAVVVARGLAHQFTGVSVDSRTLAKGNLFLALKGVRHDGHDYIGPALQKGARGVVGGKGRLEAVAVGERACWFFEVDDTLGALGEIARAWRGRFPIPVIGVTGSNGKTTCKNMVAAVLGVRFKVARTEGNLNNLIGVPLTLFGLKKEHEVAVVEMGMSRPGEIKRLAAISRSSAAVITNVGRAHLEGFASPERIVEAKAELLGGTEVGGPVFLNADDPATTHLARRARGPVTLFGFDRKADVRAEEIRQESVEGCRAIGRCGPTRFELKLKLAGRHNVRNALAALAVGRAYGVEIQEGIAALARLKAAPLRSEVVKLPHDLVIVADCYNANPDSMRAALETVRSIAADRPIVAVLGDMLELGEASSVLHREVGREAALKGVSRLLAVGRFNEEMIAGYRDAAPGREAIGVGEAEKAARMVGQWAKPSHLILVKGSRGVGLEGVVAALKGRFGH